MLCLFFLPFSLQSQSHSFTSTHYRAKPVSIKNEDDILHLTNEELPTFGKVLSPSDSERFLQFFTVPYLRIPLILDFFANGDPGRLVALKTKSLQLIVDAALFEPGMWKPVDFMERVDQIPIINEDKLERVLSTPLGTLFNEIAKSPDVLVNCVIKMLERAVDMDVGRYVEKSSSGPLILYASRLAVRIEGFMKFALRKCNEAMGGVEGGGGGQPKPRPRGLEFMEVHKVQKAVTDLRRTLDDRVIPMLEYWIDPARSGNNAASSTSNTNAAAGNNNKQKVVPATTVDVSNLVHAHLIYLFKNYTVSFLHLTLSCCFIVINITHAQMHFVCSTPNSTTGPSPSSFPPPSTSRLTIASPPEPMTIWQIRAPSSPRHPAGYKSLNRRYSTLYNRSGIIY